MLGESIVGGRFGDCNDNFINGGCRLHPIYDMAENRSVAEPLQDFPGEAGRAGSRLNDRGYHLSLRQFPSDATIGAPFFRRGPIAVEKKI